MIVQYEKKLLFTRHKGKETIITEYSAMYIQFVVTVNNSSEDWQQTTFKICFSCRKKINGWLLEYETREMGVGGEGGGGGGGVAEEVISSNMLKEASWLFKTFHM